MKVHSLLFAAEEAKKPLLAPQIGYKFYLGARLICTIICLLPALISSFAFVSDLGAVDAPTNPDKPGRFNGHTWCEKHEPTMQLNSCLDILRSEMKTKLTVAISIGVAIIILNLLLHGYAFLSRPKVKETKQALTEFNADAEKQANLSSGL